MNFERLNNSITLNSGEAPSIYMALCMVESMFKDIEDAVGGDISRADVGDEQLPTKLIWLSRKLLKIWSENADSFERNRSRLDDMMKKLREQEAELELIGDSDGAYARLKEKEATLAAALSEAHEKKEETDRLRVLCEAKAREIAALQDCDVAGAERELERLNAEQQTLSEQYAETSDTLQKVREAVASMREQAKALALSLQNESQTLEDLRSEKAACVQEREEAIKATDALREELAAENETRDRALADRAYYELKLAELKQEIAVCQNETIPPLTQEIEAQTAALETQKAELNGLKKEREEAIYRSAQLNRQIEDAKSAAEIKRSELGKKQEELSLAEQTLAAVKNSIDGETEKLAALQTEADGLRHTRLPELKAMIAENEKENEDLKGTVDGLRERMDELIGQNERLKAEEFDLSKNVDELTQIRAELTASYDAKNEALSELRKNVEALRGKTDRQKEQQYRRQLEEEQEKLLELDRTCSELEQQIAALEAENESRQSRADALKAQKDSVDAANSRIGALIRELAPFGSSELTEQTRELQTRQRFLEETQAGLNKAIGYLAVTLNASDGSYNRPERVGELLQRCGKGLDWLQGELLKCANDVKAAAKTEERI